MTNKEIIKREILKALEIYDWWDASVRKAITNNLYKKVMEGGLILNASLFERLIKNGEIKRSEVFTRLNRMISVTISRDKELQDIMKKYGSTK